MTEENKNVYYLNRLEPLLMQLKPRLNYLLYQMKRFDENTEKILKNINNNQKDYTELFTHRTFFINDLSFKYDFQVNKAWGKYKKNVFEKYSGAMKNVGMFFRDVTYIGYVINTLPKEWITKEDKIIDALSFANNLFYEIQGRLQKILNFIEYEYSLLCNDASDWFVYQNITKISESFFGNLIKYFSSKDNFNYLVQSYYSFMFDYSYGVLRTKTQKKITDEYIFNYSNDFSSLKDKKKIEEIAKELDNKYKSAVDDIEKNGEKNYEDALTNCTTEYLSQVIKQLKDSEIQISDYIKKNKRADKIFSKYKYGTQTGLRLRLTQLRNVTINQYQLINDTLTGTVTASISEKLSLANISYYCYNLAVLLFYLAAETKVNIGNIESLFIDEESFFNDVFSQVNELDKITRITDIKKAEKELEIIQNRIEAYKLKANELINQGRSAGAWIDIAFAVVIGIGVMIVAPYAVGFLAGALSGTAQAVAIAQTVGVLGSAALVTGASQLFNYLDRGQIPTISETAYSFGMNVVSFATFGIVGKGVSSLLKAGAITNKVAICFIGATANFATSMVMTSVPFMIQLKQTGNGQIFEGRGKEWLKFTATQAAFAGLFALSGSILEGFTQKITYKGYNAGEKIYVKNVEAKFSTYEKTIGGYYKTIKQQVENLEKRYQGKIELTKENFNEMKSQYEQALKCPKELLKFLKGISKDLAKAELMLRKEYGYSVPCQEGELALLEQAIIDIENTLDSMLFIDNHDYELACRICDNVSKTVCQISETKTIYFGKLEEIINNLDKVNQINFYGGSVRVTKSPALEYFPDTKVLQIESKYTVKSGDVVNKIDVIDFDGKSDMALCKYENHFDIKDIKNAVYKIEPFAETFIKVHVDEYNNFYKLSDEKMVERIRNAPPMDNGPHFSYPLTEYERNVFIELEKSGMIKPTRMVRLHPGDPSGNLYNIALKPVVFFADLFYFQGMGNVTNGKIIIGYNKNQIKITPTDHVFVIEYYEKMFVNSNYANVRKAFELYYKWGKEYETGSLTTLDNRKVKIDKVKYKWDIENNLKRFRKNYESYGLNKTDTKTKAEIDAAWKQIEEALPSEEKYKELKAGKLAGETVLASICDLLDNYLSVASLFSGKEYTFTYTNHIGVYEKLLIGPKDISDIRTIIDKPIATYLDLE
ncbi:hypothetical protein [Treponema succinifaciens]|uniref:Uncharacterized protein n=1 Tax=Treponema succinifaciens (strain ATCC 33096 / DSM 2489 / 6091) TaxID=869209 RepID=F2NYJ3_TRES6|nr:hypothetical protein [Treponema succinifaciens]AEB15492.1 hypothetical protein Tresu_2631 [Treponema succinifaciens DSM 2489]